MWNAFSGYGDIYGELPPARLVRRVRSYISACNEKSNEDYAEARKKQEEAEREAARTKMSQR